ncbi:MAG: DUF3800 domain-containing protein [Myxococcaceae bacterium]|nr:DUF3800 domain-containing protein [Myxococcaceae bacterium]
MSAPTTIFMDECGYTGEDLLNPDQPVFVLGTLNFSEEEAVALKNRFFSDIQAAELKHASMPKRSAQRRMVTNFLRHLAVDQPGRALAYIANKKFTLVCWLVDSLVETPMHERGFNLYERGGNIALANLIHAALPFMNGDELLRRFQKLIREKSADAYVSLFRFLAEEQRKAPAEIGELLSLIGTFDHVYGSRALEEVQGFSLTFGVSAALELMASWRAVTPGEMVLVHDRSSEMRKASELWSLVVDPSVAPAVVGYDRRKTQFPIAVKETRFEDSKSFAGLQLADVFAGAMTYWARFASDPAHEYGKALREVVPMEFICDGLVPSDAVTPEELGTDSVNAGDPIEHTMSILLGGGGRSKG